MIRGAGSKLDAKEQKMIDGDGGRRAERNATAPEAWGECIVIAEEKERRKEAAADAVFIITKAENEIGREGGKIRHHFHCHQSSYTP